MQDPSLKTAIISPKSQKSETPKLVAGLGAFASDYDILLCDVWGVIHNGVTYFKKATDALIRFRDMGGSVVLLTNAPRPQSKVIRLLDGLGVPREAYDSVVTSGDVTAAMIVARGTAPLAHIGPDYDASVFAEAERLGGRSVPRVAIGKASYVVCTGLFDAECETPADYDVRLAAMKERGLDFICANPDIVVEIGETLYHCAGALAQRYATIGGAVIQAGKPHPPIYQRALAVAAEIRSRAIDRRRVLAIGDGLNTDIRGAASEAFDAFFVTSGIHRAELQGDTGEIDVAALRRLLETNGVAAPKAALAELAW
jgi:HAD superfamily hydrolase (TIGR01459 family)